eukprot:jgi/Galph1/497/GphlegSOOS_G5265.1
MVSKKQPQTCYLIPCFHTFKDGRRHKLQVNDNPSLATSTTRIGTRQLINRVFVWKLRSKRQGYPCSYCLTRDQLVSNYLSDTKNEKVSVILLAGGVGKRMNSTVPKQFLLLHGRPVLEYSLALFLSFEQVFQLVLVMDSQYTNNLNGEFLQDPRVELALPGEERQDSVFSGLQKVKENSDLVCIHDAARPLVSRQTIEKCFADAAIHGAAVVGVPSKSTIKETIDGCFVHKTLDRSRLWEIQTPQIVRPHLLKRGFVKVHDENLTVTDDVSIIEKLGEPVKLTMGEYSNIKLTTEEDLKVAEYILLSRKTQTVQTTAVRS